MIWLMIVMGVLVLLFAVAAVKTQPASSRVLAATAPSLSRSYEDRRR